MMTMFSMKIGEPSGVWVHSSGVLVASLDGLIASLDGIAEVKCVYKHQFSTIDELLNCF